MHHQIKLLTLWRSSSQLLCVRIIGCHSMHFQLAAAMVWRIQQLLHSLLP
jgi:hypothetical protein